MEMLILSTILIDSSYNEYPVTTTFEFDDTVNKFFFQKYSSGAVQFMYTRRNKKQCHIFLEQ
jgi:hypothetical protein